MRESVVEKTVCKFAAERGWIVRKVQWVGRRGAPDRLFMRDGECVFVEFKALGKGPEPHQKREIARLRAADMTVYVIDTIADGEAIFA